MGTSATYMPPQPTQLGSFYAGSLPDATTFPYPTYISSNGPGVALPLLDPSTLGVPGLEPVSTLGGLVYPHGGDLSVTTVDPTVLIAPSVPLGFDGPTIPVVAGVRFTAAMGPWFSPTGDPQAGMDVPQLNLIVNDLSANGYGVSSAAAGTEGAPYSTLSLSRFDAGVPTALGTVTLGRLLEDGDTMSLSYGGAGQWTAWVNNVAALTATDTTYDPAGFVAFQGALIRRPDGNWAPSLSTLAIHTGSYLA